MSFSFFFLSETQKGRPETTDGRKRESGFPFSVNPNGHLMIHLWDLYLLVSFSFCQIAAGFMVTLACHLYQLRARCLSNSCRAAPCRLPEQ